MKSRAHIVILAGIIVTPLMAAPALKPDLAQAKVTAETVCISCHTIDGNSVAPLYPILAGQHVEYIRKQLNDFKAGKRVDNVMRPMALPLSDQDVVNLSAYFAAQKLKQRTAGDQKLAEAGEKIFRGGVTAKNIPACMSCHSPNGAGIPAQFPQLRSQHASYTEAQLQAFKKGVRNNDQENMMRDIAGRLSDDEIKAVAEYISGLR